MNLLYVFYTTLLPPITYCLFLFIYVNCACTFYVNMLWQRCIVCSHANKAFFEFEFEFEFEREREREYSPSTGQWRRVETKLCYVLLLMVSGVRDTTEVTKPTLRWSVAREAACDS